MKNLSDQGRPLSSLTDIGCQTQGRYFNQPESYNLIDPAQMSMAVQIIGQEAYPITPIQFGWHRLEGESSDMSAENDSADIWSLEYQGGYDGDLSEVCYQNAATCPDCGQGMTRLADQFACPACGFASCGV